MVMNLMSGTAINPYGYLALVHRCVQGRLSPIRLNLSESGSGTEPYLSSCTTPCAVSPDIGSVEVRNRTPFVSGTN